MRLSGVEMRILSSSKVWHRLEAKAKASDKLSAISCVSQTPHSHVSMQCGPVAGSWLAGGEAGIRLGGVDKCGRFYLSLHRMI